MKGKAIRKSTNSSGCSAALPTSRSLRHDETPPAGPQIGLRSHPIHHLTLHLGIGPATSALVGAAPARPVRCGSVVRKPSLPSPRLPRTDPLAPQASPHLRRRLKETYTAGHPHTASPSIHSPLNLANDKSTQIDKMPKLSRNNGLTYSVVNHNGSFGGATRAGPGGAKQPLSAFY